MRLIRWGIVYLLMALHLIMAAPVWALLMRVKVFGASTGYHRFQLFDEFIRHFDEWWLVGVKATESWGYYLFDVTNHYVRIGVDGGLITLLLFITMIIFCFKGLGHALQATMKQRTIMIGIWALGASLFAHLVSFMGVSYFDQIIVAWYILLAMIATVSNVRLQDHRILRRPKAVTHMDQWIR
jgi:hypothetical protein